MTSYRGRLCRLILGISSDQTRPDRRGFVVTDESVRRRLQQIGTTFLQGYHQTFEDREIDALAESLDAVPAERRGWAYEGAAMALTLLDGLTPWPTSRLARFLEGPGRSHIYMSIIGAGWAMTRLRRDPERFRRRMDPLLGWLLIDGYGFHEGYFHWRQSIEDQRVPARLAGYARRVFDQGLGRSLWFVRGADLDRVTGTIEAFAGPRRADLWSGVGLASGYAGGVDDETLQQLRARAGAHGAALAQGVAFAAKARDRAGNPAEHTARASRIICGMSAEDAAAVTDRARPDDRPPETGPETGRETGPPAYEQWRRAIQERLSGQEVAA